MYSDVFHWYFPETFKDVLSRSLIYFSMYVCLQIMLYDYLLRIKAWKANYESMLRMTEWMDCFNKQKLFSQANKLHFQIHTIVTIHYLDVRYTPCISQWYILMESYLPRALNISCLAASSSRLKASRSSFFSVASSAGVIVMGSLLVGVYLTSK